MSSNQGSKRSYTNQLQGCNAVHILSGLISFGLACSQFSDISLENYNYIDFRLLNWVHVVTGAVGIFMVLRNYGSITAKSLYIISCILGLFTAGFYANTIVQAVRRYEEVSGYSDLEGAEDDGYSQDKRNHTGKIAVCAVMIVIGVVEFVVSLISIRFLAKLASETNSNLANPDLKDRGRLAFVAGMKIFFSAATVVLGAYLEHLYQKQTKYIKIGWEELAGGIVACSGFVDLVAVNGNRHNLLNLKVSLVLSITAAVVSLRTLDHMMSGYFLSDVSEYTNYQDPTDSSEDPFGGLLPAFTTADPTSRADTKRQLFIKFSIHASVIGCLVLLFIHSIISAVEAGSYMERSITYGYATGVETMPAGGVTASVVDHNLHRQRNCLGVFQFSWGVLLIALCIISLVPWQFAEGYTNGPGILWVGCLFVAAGSASSSRIKTLTTAVYTLAVISSVVALEYFLFSINSIYQSATNEMYKGEVEKKRTGRIVLYSIQTAVLLGEFLTATLAAVTFGKEIQRLPRNSGYQSGAVDQKSYLSLFHFIYAIFTIGVSIVSEVGVWKYEASPIHNSYVKQTNGPVIFVAGIIQVLASSKPEFLLPNSILQVVCAGIAFFVLAPAVSNLYYLVTMYQAQYQDPLLLANIGPFTESESNKKLFQEVAIGLTATVVVLSMVEYVVSIICAMHSSYLMHHYFSGVRSDGGRFSTMRSHLVPAYYGEPSQLNGGTSIISQPHSNGVQNGGLKNGGLPVQKYFGNDYRTYAENRMYNPEDVIFKTGDSNQYGYVLQNRLNSYAQTNIRHVFHNVHNGYLTAYT